MKNGKKVTIKKKISKVTRKTKKTFKDKAEKYFYPSIIFGLMLAGFNYVFLILSLYSACYTGMFINAFDNVVINVLLNTTFDFLLYASTFFVVSYLFLEVVVNKYN